MKCHCTTPQASEPKRQSLEYKSPKQDKTDNMLLRINTVLLFSFITVAKIHAKPLVQHDSRVMQEKNIFRFSQAMSSDNDEGVFHLPSILNTKKPLIEGETKQFNFRKRISSSTNQFQKSSVKTIGALLLKEAVHRSKSPCGVPDLPKQPTHASRFLTRRPRRYVLHGSKLTGSTITWNVPSNGWSTKLGNAVANKTLVEAFRIWAEVIPLVFRWVDEGTKHDITIKFAKRSHGDQDPFDGPGGVLAHAFYPQYSSDIHFDDDEPWTAKSQSRSLLSVAVHEIGHSMGLQHSLVSGSIMNRYYKDPSNTGVKLHADDIAGAQAIYGLCDLPSLDAIESSMYDYKTYAFKDDLFWEFEDQSASTAPGSPRKISSFWKGVPDNLDAVLLWGWNWHLYFFKGSDYYRYDGTKVLPGYPRKISDGWQGIPDNIDAAFTLSSRITYFVKGDLLYKFNNDYDKLEPSYPKKLNYRFPVAPFSVDAAFRWYFDGQLYFFKDEYFYKWSEAENVVKGPYNTLLEWKNLCYV